MENNRHALKTNRSFWVTLLLGIVTLGIYPLVVYTQMVNDLNTLATPHDGKNTMHYLLVTLVLGPITCGIYTLIWGHGMCSRMHDELVRRGLSYDFGTKDYWLWGMLGSLIIVGPFIYSVKYFKAMNLLCGDYNARG